MTPQQLTALKNEINADPALSALPNTPDDAFVIAAALNQLASPDYLVWRTEVPVQAIFDAIEWSKYTPVDAADNSVIYTNRLLLIQTKQMNLQNMIVGRETVDALKANIRAGLRDAVIALPAGAGGALVSAGGASGATVLAACTRQATRGEKVLVAQANVTTGTTTAAIMGYEGQIGYQDVLAARAA
jgi:hypothetical protein